MKIEIDDNELGMKGMVEDAIMSCLRVYFKKYAERAINRITSGWYNNPVTSAVESVVSEMIDEIIKNEMREVVYEALKNKISSISKEDEVIEAACWSVIKQKAWKM